MPGETPTPQQPNEHEPKTWIGRQIWDIHGILSGPPGKRAYDKKRVTILVVLLAVVQLGVQLATKVITLQFEAHDKLIAGILKSQETQHKETVDNTKELAGAFSRMACELRASNDTNRAMNWHERPPPRQECK
jgi:hypothetical protein